jgi:Tfp pilus assembly protein PilV
VEERLPSRAEAGFTFIEALIAMAILVVGLLGVASLMGTAAGANSLAQRSTTAIHAASRRMESLEQAPFDDLAPGGSLTTNVTGYFECEDQMCVRWEIEQLDSQVLYIRVTAGLVGGQDRLRARAELFGYRACTVSPPCPTL